jgi:hypothetical protein
MRTNVIPFSPFEAGVTDDIKQLLKDCNLPMDKDYLVIIPDIGEDAIDFFTILDDYAEISTKIISGNEKAKLQAVELRNALPYIISKDPEDREIYEDIVQKLNVLINE